MASCIGITIPSQRRFKDIPRLNGPSVLFPQGRSGMNGQPMTNGQPWVKLQQSRPTPVSFDNPNSHPENNSRSFPVARRIWNSNMNLKTLGSFSGSLVKPSAIPTVILKI